MPLKAFDSISHACSSIKSIKSTQSEQLTRTSQCLFVGQPVNIISLHGIFFIHLSPAFFVAKVVEDGTSTARGHEAEKLLDQDPSSYWRLNAYEKTGRFILDFEEEVQVDGIELMNVDNSDQHTKEIRVGVSSSQQGPWNEILHEVLPDTRKEPLSLLRFGTYGQSKGRFLKCQILDKYGNYAGLKHFSAFSGFWKRMNLSC